jgi:hypothetical protein
MSKQLPKRIFLVALVCLAPIFMAGPLTWVRNAGDRMWGTLAIDVPAATGIAVKLGQGDSIEFAPSRGIRYSTLGGSAALEMQGTPFITEPYGVKFANSVALTSFPACSATYEGTVMWDSTNELLRYCNGTAWHGTGHDVFHFAYYYDAKTVVDRQAQNRTDLSFIATNTSARITCTAQTTGVGAGNVTVAILKNGVSQYSYTLPCVATVNTDYPGVTTGIATFPADYLGISVVGSTCTTPPTLMCNLEVRGV